MRKKSERESGREYEKKNATKMSITIYIFIRLHRKWKGVFLLNRDVCIYIQKYTDREYNVRHIIYSKTYFHC